MYEANHFPMHTVFMEFRFMDRLRIWWTLWTNRLARYCSAVIKESQYGRCKFKAV